MTDKKLEASAARIAKRNLESAILKLRNAIENKKIKGLLITEAEIASILLALGVFKND